MKKFGLVSLSAIGLSAALLAGISFAPSLAADYLSPSDYLHWATPPGEAKYNAIDGHRMWQYVVEQAKIARDYRDAGHPQYWGRIDGTSADEADVKWLLGKYKQFGLTDVHDQPVLFFMPQWMGKSWSVNLVGGGKTMKLESAQAGWGIPSTKGEIDLEVVYVGQGTAADFVGRDVKGKAVLTIKEGGGSNFAPDVMKRATVNGAAAILAMDPRGENHKSQSYRSYTRIPTFNLGTDDGKAIRDLIGKGEHPHLKIRVDAEWVNGMKSHLVWGTLPGATDETIYVIAHRDGWFEASGDNASGVATLLGLAEYYSKIPQAQRKRTMIFIGTDGHHNIRPGWYGAAWLVANRQKYFSKTALMINAEHPAEVLTHGFFDGNTTESVPLEWYAGGGIRPKLQRISADAFHEFGLPVWTQPSLIPPGGDLAPFAWFLPGVVAQANGFNNMHVDADGPQTVSWTALEAAARSYAKIIDEVNKLPLSDLQAKLQPDPNAPGAPRQHLDVSHCQAWIADSTKPCAISDETLGQRGTAMEVH